MARDDDEVMTKFNTGVVECEKPNEFLYKFEGSLTLNGSKIGFGEN